MDQPTLMEPLSYDEELMVNFHCLNLNQVATNHINHTIHIDGRAECAYKSISSGMISVITIMLTVMSNRSERKSNNYSCCSVMLEPGPGGHCEKKWKSLYYRAPQIPGAR